MPAGDEFFAGSAFSVDQIVLLVVATRCGWLCFSFSSAGLAPTMLSERVVRVAVADTRRQAAKSDVLSETFVSRAAMAQFNLVPPIPELLRE